MKYLLQSSFLAISFVVFTFSGAASGQEAAGLFRMDSEPRVGDAAKAMSPASIREANITFDRPVSASIAAAGEIRFPLLDGKTYTAKRSFVEDRGLDNAAWSGKIVVGSFSGDVILTFYKGYVSGLIYSPNGIYEITPRGATHILMEIDQDLLPECGGAIRSDDSEVRTRPSGAADSGDRIDVLVMYTTATKNILGGDAQAITHSQNAVDASNLAYRNSTIRQRLRLVHAEEYLYTETPNYNGDLSNFRNNVVVQTLRNDHNADLVAMIGELQGVCGIAYLMGSSSSGSPNTGFSATGRSCAVATLSFAHELGHNMGSHHNPENGSFATFPYGYGHYVNGSFRTVMSYTNPCTSGCPRIPNFSSPGIFRGPHATGIDDARDNARSINNVADVVANYRYSLSSITMSNFSNAAAIPRLIERELMWSSDALDGNVNIQLSRNEGFSWQTIVADTPNDGIQKFAINGRPTKRARLRIVSVSDPAVSDSSTGNLSIR